MRRPPNLLADKPVAPPATRPVEAPSGPTNYVELYGLAKPPFEGSSGGRGFILFNSHRRAFELVIDHLLRGHGPVLLVGDEGIGKTEMLHAAADMAEEAGSAVIRLFRPPAERLRSADVLQALGGSETAVPKAVREKVMGPPRHTVVIDDFDLLPADCLPHLRGLMEPTEVEEDRPAMVLTISSAGSRRAEVNQLLAWQRNTIRLIPLSPAEVRQYIERSLWVAGGTTRRLIEADAIKLVVAQSAGVPGTINRLMDAVLTTGFVRGDAMITARTVTAAIGPAAIRPRPHSTAREPQRDGVAAWALQIVSVGLFVVGAAVFCYRAFESSPSQPPVAAPAPPVPLPTPAPSAPKPKTDAPAAGPLSPDLIDALMKRGDDSLSLGDVAAARLYFQRAAEGGSGLAAVAVAKTYDPAYALPGSSPDVAKAAMWYRRAVAMGDPTAAGLLQALPAH